MKKEPVVCQICKKRFFEIDLFPASLIKNNILEVAKKQCPDFDEQGFICYQDLANLRAHRIEQILTEDKGELTKLDQDVLQSLKDQDLITENVNKKFEKSLTFSNRLADKIAKFGGSWKFIFSFLSIIFFWICINALVFLQKPFDPYPFILLNLLLSCLAAIQAPVILMAQNRQAEKDKLQAEDDYRTNLKAELEIRLIHSKLDQFMKNQWERLLEIQKIQIDLAEELFRYKKDHKDKT